MKLLNVLILSISILSGCTVYRSPERKDFESDFQSKSPNFRVQSLKQSGCSNKTIRTNASASTLITVLQGSSETGSLFLWEYLIENKSFFESDNLKGVYCAYEAN
ncbi:MAG: hypothetical protein WA160_04280 [Pseudobdellovibrio sp.]